MFCCIFSIFLYCLMFLAHLLLWIWMTIFKYAIYYIHNKNISDFQGFFLSEKLYFIIYGMMFDRLVDLCHLNVWYIVVTITSKIMKINNLKLHICLEVRVTSFVLDFCVYIWTNESGFCVVNLISVSAFLCVGKRKKQRLNR